MPFPTVFSTNLDDGLVQYTARGLMVIPAGGAHVRQIEFRLPLLENIGEDNLDADLPTVQATVYGGDNDAGTAFAVWSIQLNDVGETQVAVSAMNVNIGQQIPDIDFYCHILVIGRPA
jgi:hypothetical protein